MYIKNYCLVMMNTVLFFPMSALPHPDKIYECSEATAVAVRCKDSLLPKNCNRPCFFFTNVIDSQNKVKIV